MNIIRLGGTAAAIFLVSTSLAEEGQRSAPAAAGPAESLRAAPQAAQPARTGLTWLTDLQQAKARAKAEGKSILLFFHGSDWCPPCVQMQHQVMDSPEFARFARQSLILVDVDFPEKGGQSRELRRANLELKARFNLSPEWAEGFPTLVLLNPGGETVYQETGYSGGGPAAVLAKLLPHTAAATLGTNPGGFKNLTVDEFARMADEKTNVILDVRTPGEFEAGHLFGALNLNFNASDFAKKTAALDPRRTYLIHCASGGRSLRACELMARLGFTKLYNLPGGFRAWARAGKPVEK